MAREVTPLRPEPTAAALCEDGALTIKAAVEFSGIGRTKLYELMRTGQLHQIRVDGSARTLLARRELVEILARGMEDA